MQTKSDLRGKGMKGVRVLLLPLILAGLLTGCIIYREPVTIGIDDHENAMLFIVAKELGYLDDRFKIVEFESKGDSVEAFYLGRLDVVYSTLFDALYFHGKGDSGKIFLLTSHTLKRKGLLVREGVNNLEGSRIAVEVSANEYLELINFLQDEGLSLVSLDILFLPEEEGHNAFLREEVDGIYYYDEYTDVLMEKGVIYRNSRGLKKIKEVLIASSPALKKKKDLKKIVDAWYAALTIKLQEPERFHSILERLGHDKSEYVGLYRKMYYFHSDNMSLLKEEKIENTIKKELEDMGVEADIKEIYSGEIIQ